MRYVIIRWSRTSPQSSCPHPLHLDSVEVLMRSLLWRRYKWPRADTDRPGTQLQMPPPITFSIQDNFAIFCNTYIFYRPPDDSFSISSGNHSVFMPVAEFNWSAGQTTISNNLASTWSLVGPNLDGHTLFANYSLPLVQWDMTTNPPTFTP